MSREESVKLKTMLGYWLEHNRKHGQEFREWAEKAKSFGALTAGEEILRAAEEMNKVDEFLLRALKRLEED